MTRFATMKEITASTSPAGSLKGRGWSGSWRLIAPKASGTTAYPITVAETMKPTSSSNLRLAATIASTRARPGLERASGIANRGPRPVWQGERGQEAVVLLGAPQRDPAPPGGVPERLALSHQDAGLLEDLGARADHDEVGVRGDVLEPGRVEGLLDALSLALYQARALRDGLRLAHRNRRRRLPRLVHAERDVGAPDVVRETPRGEAVADSEGREPVHLRERPRGDHVLRRQHETVRPGISGVVDELVVGLVQDQEHVLWQRLRKGTHTFEGQVGARGVVRVAEDHGARLAGDGGEHGVEVRPVVLVERDLAVPQPDDAGRGNVEGERGPRDDDLPGTFQDLHQIH